MMVDNTVDQNLMGKLQKIRLLILDVDGVMTDGSLIFNDLGQESKSFYARDGHGLKLLMRYDVDVALLTGRQSAVVEFRAQDLGISEIYQRVWDKLKVYEEIIAQRGLVDESVAFMGDDIVDIPVLRRVGLAITVADGTQEAKMASHYVTSASGGRGAVREVCELILKAKGFWPDVAEKYRFVK